MMQLGNGGPALKMRGFFDFNFGLGTNSNSLISKPLKKQSRASKKKRAKTKSAQLFLRL